MEKIDAIRRRQNLIERAEAGGLNPGRPIEPLT
jgi:hypothetical protein